MAEEKMTSEEITVPLLQENVEEISQDTKR